jgi:hypothetical protein
MFRRIPWQDVCKFLAGAFFVNATLGPRLAQRSLEERAGGVMLRAAKERPSKSLRAFCRA